MGSAIRKLLYLGIVECLLAPIAQVGFGVQREPIGPSGSKASYTDVRQAQKLCSRYDPRAMPPERVTIVLASERDPKPLLASGVAPLKRIVSTVVIANDGVQFTLSSALPVPEYPLGRHVNLHLTIAPSRAVLVVFRLVEG